MHELDSIKDILISKIYDQVQHLEQADCEELGQAIDMVKDINEAEYYCEIVKAMKKDDETKYYREAIDPLKDANNMTRYNQGKLDSMKTKNGEWIVPNMNPYEVHYYTERDMQNLKDPREGRSPARRKSYIEAKQRQNDKDVWTHELEIYVRELSNDIIEMIADATPEEKQILKQKISALATKIA